MTNTYYPTETNTSDGLTEADALAFWLEWAGNDEQRLIALDNDLDRIEANHKEHNGRFFGRLAAAMVLFRLYQKVYIPNSTNVLYTHIK